MLNVSLCLLSVRAADDLLVKEHELVFFECIWKDVEFVELLFAAPQEFCLLWPLVIRAGKLLEHPDSEKLAPQKKVDEARHKLAPKLLN